MNGTIPPEEKTLACEALVEFAKNVVLFSPEFDDFIRKMLPEDTGLIATLVTHEFTAGHLETAHHGLQHEVCSLKAIIEAAKNGTLEDLVAKAYLAEALGILALRCHDAESEAPIV